MSAMFLCGAAGLLAHCNRHTVGTAAHRRNSHSRGQIVAVGSSSCHIGAVLGPLPGSAAILVLPSPPDAKVLRHRNSRPEVLTDTDYS